MRRGYSILDHPSDLGIKAYGGTLAQAFEEAAAALVAMIVDPSTIQPLQTVEIELQAEDTEQLLVKWLSEILYLFDGKQFIAKNFDVHQLQTNNILAKVSGEKFSPLRHRARIDVKAITYHQVAITESPDGAVVQVFLDI
jgi:SHS2 domain-containing protein